MSEAAKGPRLVKVYKTRRKADTYLYVDFGEDLSRVPETLLTQFGTPELALSLSLSADRALASVDAGAVLQAIDDAGYFLQMPPADGGVDAIIERSRRS